MNIWKSTKVYTAFLFLGLAFWKENIEDRVKLFEVNVLNCCLKMTTADLHKCFKLLSKDDNGRFA